MGVLDVDGVIGLTDSFNTLKMRQEFGDLLRRVPQARATHDSRRQLGLVCRPGTKPEDVFSNATGSLLRKSLPDLPYDSKLEDTAEFTVPTISSSNEPYLSGVVIRMRELVGSYGRRIGRIRFMTQDARTCLSMHRDMDECRFHIPMNTHRNAFFVVDDKICRMERAGYVYILNTRSYHTAVNTHEMMERTHLVFDTYKQGSAVS
jgi:hypothetical protein